MILMKDSLILWGFCRVEQGLVGGLNIQILTTDVGVHFFVASVRFSLSFFACLHNLQGPSSDCRSLFDKIKYRINRKYTFIAKAQHVYFVAVKSVVQSKATMTN